MEKNNYLNKALFDAAKTLDNISRKIQPQKKSLDNTVSQIKKELLKNGTDVSIITKMEKAAKTGDLNTILQAKNEILNK